MGTIGFSDNISEIWYVRSWVFWQILDDVMSQYTEDSEMAKEFDLAKANSGLSVDLLEPELATRITSAIRQVASGILSGAINSGIHNHPYGDAETVELYRGALQQLLATFPDKYRGLPICPK